MIVSGLLVLCLLGVALYGYKVLSKGNFGIGLAIVFLALVAVFFVITPEYSTVIANKLGVGRGADLLLYLFFVMVLMLILLTHIKFRQHDVLITELARSLAISNAKAHDSENYFAGNK